MSEEKEKKRAEYIIRKVIRRLEIYSVCGNWIKFFREDIETRLPAVGKEDFVFIIKWFSNTEFVGIILDLTRYEVYIEYKHNGIDIKKKLNRYITRNFITGYLSVI
jgi:hypothetical protein